MIDRRTLVAWQAALAMLCIAGTSLSANKQTIEPECAIPDFKPSGSFAKDDRFVARQVVIPRGNFKLTDLTLKDARLERLTCVDGIEACVYLFPPSCGDPKAVAEKLSANIFACADEDKSRSHSSRAPRSIGNVFPHAIIRLPEMHGEKKPLEISDTRSDPYFARFQSALKSMGAEQAWRPIEQYKVVGVTTAVIDGGVDLDHPDLAPQMKAGVEIPCLMGACDGGNPQGDHGTAMAGIIGAARYNGWMIGAAYNTRLLPIRISAGEASSFDLAAATAVRCAAHRGAKVVNFSIGGNVPLPLLADAVTTTTKNLLFVASAGNAGGVEFDCEERRDSGTQFPASYRIDRMIVVMSHDKFGAREEASSWSPNVDIAAPGFAMYPIPCDTPRTERCYNFLRNNTSNAAAYVSGAAALLWSVYDDWSFADIKWRILANAIDEPKLRACMTTSRRLDLERMMYPVKFKPADNLRRIKLADLQPIDFKKLSSSTKLDLSSTFPDGRCKSSNVALVRAHLSEKDSLVPAKVKKGDSIQFLVTCLRTDGKRDSARSLAYEVVD